jgi:OmcA/MtrC family decaheme c-type cytochrome
VLADPNPPSPGRGLVFAHGAGAKVSRVRVGQKTAGTDYSLDIANGRIVELVEFGADAAVIVCYVADYRVPSVYPNPANASDARDDGQGKWTGKELVSGTYVASLAAARALEYEQGTTLTAYRATSPEATLEVLVGDAASSEPYTRIPDAAACLACHQRISYHGLYEGFTTCLTCHGSGGTEDLARATVPGAPATTGVTVEFRDLLHRIHRGRELAGSNHVVVGSAPLGSSASFIEHRYDAFATLPSFPDRALDCARCHGEDEAAGLLPSDRSHPDQTNPLQVWTAACLGCHDSQAVRAHFASNTAPDGAEACSICHDPDEFLDARQAHFDRKAPR